MLVMNDMLFGSHCISQSLKNFRFLFFDLIHPKGLNPRMKGEYEYWSDPR